MSFRTFLSVGSQQPRSCHRYPGRVFERFTQQARTTVVLAQEESRRLNHNYIGTEHLLLGLVRQREAIAGTALQSLGVSLDSVRGEVESMIGPGQEPPAGHVPFTPRGKKVLDLSLQEALSHGHYYVSTGHILLGLLAEGEGVGAQVLTRRRIDLPKLRERVIRTLWSDETREAPPEAAGEITAEPRPRGRPGLAGHGSDFREPLCPGCRRVVSETAAYRLMAVPSSQTGETVDMVIVYCRGCGISIAGLRA